MSDKDEDLGATLKRLYETYISPSRKSARDKEMVRRPGAVPLGSGIAGAGKRAVSGRQRQIDAAVEEMD